MNYKKRWPIEKIFRRSKQYLGLEDCYSTSPATQDNHTSATLLAYAIAQLEKKSYRLDTTEAAIRQLKVKNVKQLEQRFTSKINTFSWGHA